MFRPLVFHLVLCSTCLGLTGCFYANPHAALPYGVNLERLKSSPPEPVALAPGPAPLKLDTIKIEPEKAVGYADLPSSITRIYDVKPQDLSLGEVVLQDLSNNRNIKIEGYTLRIAEWQVPVREGIYDLLATGNYTYSRGERQSGPGSASHSRSRSGQLALSQLLPTGGTLSAAYNSFWNGTSNFGNNTTFQLNQPLLQGWGPAVTNAGIRIAFLESQGSLADYKAELENQLQSALTSYWQLLGAIQTFNVNVISYAAAKELLRIDQAKFDVGLIANSDLLQTQAALDARYDSIVESRAAVRNLEDQLKLQIFVDHGTPQWAAQLRPTQPVAWREVRVDMDRAVEQGLQLRPELQRAQSNVDQARERLLVARNTMLPVLDFIAHLIPNGMGTGFDEAFRRMDSGKATSYDMGLQFSFPLQNRAARFGYKQALAQLLQSEERLLAVRDQVTQQVRQAARDYTTARERITVTESQIASEQANLDTELARLQVGLSTTFRVLQFQENLATAQLSHIQAVIDTNTSAIALEQSRGTLLETYGVHPADRQ